MEDVYFRSQSKTFLVYILERYQNIQIKIFIYGAAPVA